MNLGVKMQKFLHKHELRIIGSIKLDPLNRGLVATVSCKGCGQDDQAKSDIVANAWRPETDWIIKSQYSRLGIHGIVPYLFSSKFRYSLPLTLSREQFLEIESEIQAYMEGYCERTLSSHSFSAVCKGQTHTEVCWHCGREQVITR